MRLNLDNINWRNFLTYPQFPIVSRAVGEDDYTKCCIPCTMNDRQYLTNATKKRPLGTSNFALGSSSAAGEAKGVSTFLIPFRHRHRASDNSSSSAAAATTQRRQDVVIIHLTFAAVRIETTVLYYLLYF